MSSQEIGKPSWQNPEIAASLAGYVPAEDPILDELIRKAKTEPDNVAARVAVERYKEAKDLANVPPRQSKIVAFVARITGKSKKAS